MAYTTSEIKTIHQKASAIPNREYTTLDGALYIGLPNGRLSRRDIAVTSLQRDVETLSSTKGATGATGATGEKGDTGATGPQGEPGVETLSTGNKYKISSTDSITIEDSKEYYVHRNFELLNDSTFTINLEGQLCIGDGILRLGSNSTLVNNGEIILT